MAWWAWLLLAWAAGNVLLVLALTRRGKRKDTIYHGED